MALMVTTSRATIGPRGDMPVALESHPMRSATVDGFAPSRNGLHFANRFPHVHPLRLRIGPLDLGVGDAADGLCGGMSYVVRDLWEAGRLTPPRDTQAPAQGTRRFHALVERQIESFDFLRAPLRFYDLQAFRPDRSDAVARRLGRRSRTAETAVLEWPKIRSELDAGRLALVGLVRATGLDPFVMRRHHQVVAYGYDVDGDRLALHVYDPNHPDRDDVEVRLRLGIERRGPGTFLQTTGEELFAFWLLPYRAADPAAWR